MPDIETKKNLIWLNVGLENHVDSVGDLHPLSNVADAQAAHFIISCHGEGCERFFRHDLPERIRKRLSILDYGEALYNFELVKDILSEDKVCKECWGGKGYVFHRIPAPDEFSNVLFHEGDYVVMHNDEPVAWAWSQEKNEKSAELAVEVLPEFRRLGYGRQVAAAWANHIMGEGLVAFYSHLHDNLPSQALAQSLGVVQYAVSAGYG